MEPHNEDVYCDKHGCVHTRSKWPYDIPGHKDEDGNEVLLVYVDLDEDGNETTGTWGEKPKVETVTRPAEADCTPAEWRKLWIGAPVEAGRTPS